MKIEVGRGEGGGGGGREGGGEGGLPYKINGVIVGKF